MNVFTVANSDKPVRTFEAALYLCEHLYGKNIAESLAGGLVIDWDFNTVPHPIID